jgi:hypothetical protein
MEEVTFMDRRIAFLFALSLSMSACGGNNSTPVSADSLSGNWQMTLNDASNTKINNTQSGSLIQNGGNLTGSVILSDSPCSGVGNVSGTVTGSTVSLTVDPVGTTLTLSGTTSTMNSQPSMSGNYTILSTGCAGSQSDPGTGTFIANLVTPLNGNITGSFVSNEETSYAVSGQVTQGTNNGTSSTPLSGSFTFTGFCYPNANIVGSVSGTSVVMNLADSDGAQIGQMTGTASLDGTTVTGTYNDLGLGKGAASGCTGAGKGTVTLAIAGS